MVWVNTLVSLVSLSSCISLAAAQLDPYAMNNLVNNFRSQSGRPPLQVDARLNAAASEFAAELARRCTLTHKGSDGSSPSDRIARKGIDWTFAAENAAQGQTSMWSAENSWENSDGHRRNLLNPSIRYAGYGVAIGSSGGNCPGQYYWVQDFANFDGGPQGGYDAPKQDEKPEEKPKPEQKPKPEPEIKIEAKPSPSPKPVYKPPSPSPKPVIPSPKRVIPSPKRTSPSPKPPKTLRTPVRSTRTATLVLHPTPINGTNHHNSTNSTRPETKRSKTKTKTKTKEAAKTLTIPLPPLPTEASADLSVPAGIVPNSESKGQITDDILDDFANAFDGLLPPPAKK